MKDNKEIPNIFKESLDSDGFEITRLWEIIVEYQKVIISLTFVFTLITSGYSLWVTPVYKAEVLVAPAKPSNSNNQLNALSQQFGSLARLGGFNISESSTNDKVVVEILKSRIFTNKFIKDNNLLPIFFEEGWDFENKKWLTSQPTYFEIFESFDDIRIITFDNRTGLITISIRWKDPEIAVMISNKIVESVNDYMRLEAIEEAEKSIVFLEEQIERTNIEDLRKLIFTLVEQQIQTIMLANVRKEFAFKIIDPASVPKYREYPKRKRMVFTGSLLGLLVGFFYSLIHSLRKKPSNAN